MSCVFRAVAFVLRELLPNSLSSGRPMATSGPRLCLYWVLAHSERCKAANREPLHVHESFW